MTESFYKKREHCFRCTNKKRIIILRSNPVSPDSRVEKEAYTLANNGYHVKILAWDREANYRSKDEFVTVSNIKIPITRFGFRASYGEGFKNIIPYLRFQMALRKWIRKNKNDYDIVHACDFDTAYFTYKLVKRKKKKIVFDIFDFLYGNPKGFFQKMVKKSQIRIINEADATIICSEERKKQIEGSSPKQLVVIHNSPSENQLPSVLLKQSRNNNRIRACYVGILQEGRLLKEIGDFFALNKEFELHIGGFGYLSDFFEDLSKKNDNIFFYGKLPYQKTLELEYNCDVLLALYDPVVENHVFAAPNKFYEALFLGKPLIMAKGTGMSLSVEENNIGVLVDYSYLGFETGMRKIKTLILEADDIKSRCLNLYKTKFSWDQMSLNLLNLYETL